MYGQFAYRVDAGCPTGPHLMTSVDFPSEYKLHLYIVDDRTVKDLAQQLEADGMDLYHPVMYEMFAEGWSDSFSPVTFALFLTPDQMRDLSYVEQQLTAALVHPVY